MKIAVIGAGFVGGSVINGFSTDNTEVIVVDPAHSNTSLEDAILANPEIMFVCVPTPANKNGSIDVSIVEDVVTEIFALDYKGITVIKSTITADHLKRFVNKYPTMRFVYNPEFLTEANAHDDFINPAMQILGGDWADCELVEKAYVKHSKVKIVPTFKTDIVSASLLKYTINSWLATKVTWMNELYQVHQASGAETTWEQFTEMLSRDSRVGSSHLKVPGPDGEFGFGGHCFPKDTAAFLHYVNHIDESMNLLDRAVRLNKRIKSNKHITK